MPNPFNPATNLGMELTTSGLVRVEIFDTRGRRVRVLADGYLAGGPHTWRWDGRNDAGRELPSGSYLLRAITPDGGAGCRLALVR